MMYPVSTPFAGFGFSHSNCMDLSVRLRRCVIRGAAGTAKSVVHNNLQIHVQRLQKLIYLHLLTGCFMKISLESSSVVTSSRVLEYECTGTVNRVTLFDSITRNECTLVTL